MKQATYEVEARVERHHWWFKGRRRILRTLLDRLQPALPPACRTLDVGCGTGANAPALRPYSRWLVGLDAAAAPLSVGRNEHDLRLRGDAAALPCADQAFDLVVALDVLEHLDDDNAAACELWRVLRPGGVLLVFVPALKILWGLQDDVSLHRRRYTRSMLQQVITLAGFEIERLSYFNTLLFAPILAARLAMRLRPPAELQSENQIGGAVTNAVLSAVFALEAPLLQRQNLPLGVSLACLARRPLS